MKLALADLRKNGKEALERLRSESVSHYFILMTKLLPPDGIAKSVSGGEASGRVLITMKFGGAERPTDAGKVIDGPFPVGRTWCFRVAAK